MRTAWIAIVGIIGVGMTGAVEASTVSVGHCSAGDILYRNNDGYAGVCLNGNRVVDVCWGRGFLGACVS